MCEHACALLSLSLSLSHTHTHTHTHIFPQEQIIVYRQNRQNPYREWTNLPLSLPSSSKKAERHGSTHPKFHFHGFGFHLLGVDPPSILPVKTSLLSSGYIYVHTSASKFRQLKPAPSIQCPRQKLGVRCHASTRHQVFYLPNVSPVHSGLSISTTIMVQATAPWPGCLELLISLSSTVLHQPPIHSASSSLTDL